MAIFSNFKRKFHFEFQKWKFSNFFISNFRGTSDMAKFFQISIQISKLIFFQIFPFPSSGMAKLFSRFKNKNFQFKFQKQFFFQNFQFKFSLWYKQFFLGPRLPNLLKDCKNYLFTLTKNSLHTTTVKEPKNYCKTRWFPTRCCEIYQEKHKEQLHS
jgi:hypothetical protein